MPLTDAASQDPQYPLHIVMFPWLAFGHMIPFFQLSKQLATKGNKISFVSTANNINRLPQIPPDLSHLLTFIPLPLPPVPNLPSNVEATSDLPIHQVPYLKVAHDGLAPSLTSFLQTSSPDWVIYDFAPHWLPSILSNLGIPGVYFSIFNASTLSFSAPPSAYSGGKFVGARDNLEDYTSLCEWIPFENNLRFRMSEIMKMIKSVGENASGVTDVVRLGTCIKEAKIVAIRSCPELESEYLDLLEHEILGKPVIPIGLIPPHVQSLNIDLEEFEDIRVWLDKMERKSVVYVAFGSEATLSQEETTELALGLELSELPFFWVVREESVLPVGFEQRLQERGYICRKWAPQLNILSHPSVGGFLTHSGWSSVIESLAFGCPLVLLPLINDQVLVARFLESKGIGFEIDRDESDGGSFSKESVSSSVRKLLVDEQGECYRVKAKELKEIVGDNNRHEGYIDEFEQCLKRYKIQHAEEK